MPSLRETLTRKYVELHQQVTKELGPMLPSPLEVDAEGLVILCAWKFSPLYASGDYRPALRSLAASRGVDLREADLNHAHEIAKPFLDWLVKEIKT
jgi:hypothetical protein